MHAHFLSVHKYFQFKCAPFRFSFVSHCGSRRVSLLTMGISSLMSARTLMRLSLEASLEFGATRSTPNIHVYLIASVASRPHGRDT